MWYMLLSQFHWRGLWGLQLREVKWISWSPAMNRWYGWGHSPPNPLARWWHCGKFYFSIWMVSLLFKITCNVFIFFGQWLSNLKYFSHVIWFLNSFVTAFVNRGIVIIIIDTITANTYDCLSIRNLLCILFVLFSLMFAIIFWLNAPCIFVLFTKTIELPDFQYLSQDFPLLFIRFVLAVFRQKQKVIFKWRDSSDGNSIILQYSKSTACKIKGACQLSFHIYSKTGWQIT